jgi:hypothetical protein
VPDIVTAGHCCDATLAMIASTPPPTIAQRIDRAPYVYPKQERFTPLQPRGGRDIGAGPRHGLDV